MEGHKLYKLASDRLLALNRFLALRQQFSTLNIPSLLAIVSQAKHLDGGRRLCNCKGEISFLNFTQC